MSQLPGDHSSLLWRPITRVDVDELSGLLVAIEEVDEPSDRHSISGLYEAFDAAGSDPANESVVGRNQSGVMVAYGWNHPLGSDVDPRRVHLQGGVHPGWRERGIGTALLSWQLDAAREWYERTWTPAFGALRMMCFVDEKLTAQRELFSELGLRPIRWYADMTLVFDGPPPFHPAPPGIRIVPLSHKRFEDVRVAHNEAFADHWGTQAIDATRWEEQLTSAASRLSWSWVALVEESSEVVGYVTNAAHEQDWEEQGFSEGWTDRIGVRREWRHRGIARALLTASMRSFADAGLAAAGLGVDSDNPSGAFALYEALGYRSTNTVAMYAKTEERAALDHSRSR